LLCLVVVRYVIRPGGFLLGEVGPSPMPLDIRALISALAADASAINEAYVNPRLAEALRLIGLDRTCSNPKRKATA